MTRTTSALSICLMVSLADAGASNAAGKPDKDNPAAAAARSNEKETEDSQVGKGAIDAWAKNWKPIADKARAAAAADAADFKKCQNQTLPPTARTKCHADAEKKSTAARESVRKMVNSVGKADRQWISKYGRKSGDVTDKGMADADEVIAFEKDWEDKLTQGGTLYVAPHSEVKKIDWPLYKDLK